MAIHRQLYKDAKRKSHDREKNTVAQSKTKRFRMPLELTGRDRLFNRRESDGNQMIVKASPCQNEIDFDEGGSELGLKAC